jgi:DNA-binding CsgD family transcriptional regulator
VSGEDARGVEAVSAELRVLRPGDDAVARVVASIRELLEVSTLLVVSPVLQQGGLAVERFHCAGAAASGPLERLFTDFFVDAPPRYAWYNAAEPESWQRNRVIDALDLTSEDELAQSAIYERVLRPATIQRCRQPRMLLCEGRTLVGWFGAFHDGPVEARHRVLLQRVGPPMRKRLAIDRKLGEIARQQAALEAALGELAQPALVLDRAGAILEMNAAGRALLAINRDDVVDGVAAAVHNRPSRLQFELVRLDEPGTPTTWLALARGSSDARIETAIDLATARWGLSARQREVLTHLVGGASNISISLALGVSQRAVEMQVSSLLGRAAVATRGALVASVLEPSVNRSVACLGSTIREA